MFVMVVARHRCLCHGLKCLMYHLHNQLHVFHAWRLAVALFMEAQSRIAVFQRVPLLQQMARQQWLMLNLAVGHSLTNSHQNFLLNGKL